MKELMSRGVCGALLGMHAALASETFVLIVQQCVGCCGCDHCVRCGLLEVWSGGEEGRTGWLTGEYSILLTFSHCLDRVWL